MSVLSVVKDEMNTGQSSHLCHGCLSTGRRTAPLGNYSGVFFSLIGHLQPYPVHGHENVKLCWECRAMLKKFQEFQNQLKTAQHILFQMMYQNMGSNMPLSKLTTSRKSCFDYEVHHLDTQPCHSSITTLVLSPVKPFQGQSTDVKTNLDMSTENTDPAIDSKELELQNITVLTTSVKVENIENSDYMSNDYCADFNNEYCDSKDNIPIVTKAEPKLEKRKKSAKEKSISLVAKFGKYGKLLRTLNKDWGTSYEKNFTKVHLTEAEIEQYLNQTDRVQRGFTNHPFKCEECVKGYMRQMDLYRHNDLNHHKPNTSYKCRACKKKLPTLDSLAEHWRQHSYLYQCQMCGDYCKSRVMKRHLNQQHTKVYGCSNCRLEFGSITKFAVHYKEAHGTYICDYCNKICGEKRIMEKHIVRRHMDHFCKKCNRQYKNYTKYRDHLRLFHPTQINKNANLELAYCVECDRQYPSVYKYKTHIKESPKHTPKAPIEPIPCPECGKTFTRRSYMNNHYSHMHLKVTKFHCEICNKYYANGYGLRQHRESVHLKVPKMKDKICDICGRGFHTNGVLKKHRRTHTGERPYQCGFCSASFAQITACKTHARTQHRQQF